jgi:hypothetical protein
VIVTERYAIRLELLDPDGHVRIGLHHNCADREEADDTYARMMHAKVHQANAARRLEDLRVSLIRAINTALSAAGVELPTSAAATVEGVVRAVVVRRDEDDRSWRINKGEILGTFSLPPLPTAPVTGKSWDSPNYVTSAPPEAQS